MVTEITRSSWIRAVGYVPGFLAVFTDRGEAILYKGVPSTLPGLLVAGQANANAGYRSVGRTYIELVKGKYISETIKEEGRVRELKQLMSK